MFFIGIFGIQQKQKVIKIIENLNCGNCDNITRGKLIKIFTCFHIFFIPIFKWNEKYYVECQGCNSVFTVKKEKGKAVEKGEADNITYWDLEECISKKSEHICTRCGKHIEDDFEFCPYCGSKLR